MATMKTHAEHDLEFESTPRRADIQVSKVLETPKGNKLRAIVTTNNSIILTPIGQSYRNTVILTGESGFVPGDSVVLKGIYDAVADIAIHLLDKVFDSGDKGDDKGDDDRGCETTTTVKLDKNGRVREVTTKTNCDPESAK